MPWTLLEILNAVLAAGCLVLGWLARELWAAVQTLKVDLITLRENMSDNYVRKDDFREFKSDLFAVLNRIETKIDQKQDK